MKELEAKIATQRGALENLEKEFKEQEENKATAVEQFHGRNRCDEGLISNYTKVEDHYGWFDESEVINNVMQQKEVNNG
eukprot:Nk52_evm17s255 gene=Nk52_evmTU17s255